MTCLHFKEFLSYGARRARGKALAAFLLLAPPLVAPVAATAEEVTLLALGDSLTQGYGLTREQGLVPQLEEWLHARGHQVEVINAGVSGDTTAGGAARVGWSLTDEVDAMIVTLGGNDLLRGIAPEVARENLSRILEVAGDRAVEVLLVGMPAPGNYGPDYKAAFEAIYPELAQMHGTLYFENFFEGLGTWDPGQAGQYFQPDGIHPNAEGVRRIVEALGPAVVELIATAQAKSQ